MGLVEAFVEAYIESNRPWSIGLAFNGAELPISTGYRRFKVSRQDWKMAGGSAATRGQFVFTTPVSFDEALLFDGDQIVERLPLDAPASMPPGKWTQHFIVAGASA